MSDGLPALIQRFSIAGATGSVELGFVGLAWCGELLIHAEGRATGPRAPRSLGDMEAAFLRLRLAR